jgi:hypothetical protein
MSNFQATSQPKKLREWESEQAVVAGNKNRHPANMVVCSCMGPELELELERASAQGSEQEWAPVWEPVSVQVSVQAAATAWAQQPLRAVKPGRQNRGCLG